MLICKCDQEVCFSTEGHTVFRTRKLQRVQACIPASWLSSFAAASAACVAAVWLLSMKVAPQPDTAGVDDAAGVLLASACLAASAAASVA